MLKKLFIGLGCLLVVACLILGAFMYWASPLIADDKTVEKLRSTNPRNLTYLNSRLSQERGKILAIVTSTRELGKQGKPTGYELSELSRAYWVFTVNGFKVDIASPQGGEPYAVLDTDDMGEFDYAFLNDSLVQNKIKNTLKIEHINPDDYQAVYFVGGKGAMFDFPDNPFILQLIRSFVEQKKIIAAVCHGPAALVNANDAQGNWLFANKSMTSFTNAEELLLIPHAETIFPFLLQTKLQQRGAQFNAGNDYLEHLVIDGSLITGQNPWSVWRLAEEVVKQLGHEPVKRALTSEEHSVGLLKVFHESGLNHAEKLVHSSGHEYNGQLILMHSIVEILKGELANAAGLIILADNVRMQIRS